MTSAAHDTCEAGPSAVRRKGFMTDNPESATCQSRAVNVSSGKTLTLLGSVYRYQCHSPTLNIGRGVMIDAPTFGTVPNHKRMTCDPRRPCPVREIRSIPSTVRIDLVWRSA